MVGARSPLRRRSSSQSGKYEPERSFGISVDGGRDDPQGPAGPVAVIQPAVRPVAGAGRRIARPEGEAVLGEPDGECAVEDEDAFPVLIRLDIGGGELEAIQGAQATM